MQTVGGFVADSLSPRRFHPGTRIHSLSLHENCENSSMLVSRIHRFLEHNGYAVDAPLDAAEVVLINTCSTTDELIAQMEQGIDALVGARPERTHIVLGCYRPFSEDTAHRWEAVGDRLRFVDTFNLDQLDELFLHTIPARMFRSNDLALFERYQSNISASDTFLHISTGCAFGCTYCNIKIAKGHVRSRPLSELVAEAAELVAAGVDELVLLSDDCGSYGLDRGTDLPSLVDALCAVDGRLKLKIYNAHPLMVCRYWERLEPHVAAGRFSYLCLPVQSASKRILEMMGRTYDLERVREIIGRIRALSPETHLYSHFMLNFPTETDEEFDASMAYARLFDSCLFIAFGSNRRTPAVAYGPPGPPGRLERQREVIRGMMARAEVGGFLI